MKTYKDIAGDGGSDIIAQVTEQAERVKKRLAGVRKIVAIMSGKGGVGKSSLTVNLAAALALQHRQVGILDADINGPTIARMTGVRGYRPQLTTEGISPAIAALGIRVMSMDLFLPEDQTPVIWEAPTQKDAFTWRGMMESAALREFVSDTAWGSLDFLLIDLPPGSDKLPNLLDIVPNLSGTIIVTIPSGVSQTVVGKSINIAKEVLKAPILGLVENMSAYICAHCGKTESLFPEGHAEKIAAEHRLPFLGKIPFDPRIAQSGDAGHYFLKDHAETPAAKALRQLARRMINDLDKQE